MTGALSGYLSVDVNSEYKFMSISKEMESVQKLCQFQDRQQQYLSCCAMSEIASVVIYDM